MNSYYKHFKNGVEIIIPDWNGWKCKSSSLLSLYIPYGSANGYVKMFYLSIFNPMDWSIGISKHNGHARFWIGVGLFSLFFDWLDEKSIIILNE